MKGRPIRKERTHLEAHSSALEDELMGRRITRQDSGLRVHKFADWRNIVTNRMSGRPHRWESVSPLLLVGMAMSQ